MEKKLLIALIPLTILLFITSGAVYAVDKTNEVKFADPAVETAVREALVGKTGGTVYKDECELITYLPIHGEGDILDLSGLEHLSILRQLTIINAGVADFSPLSGLTDFESVDFNSCEITDLAPLSILPNLKNLSLHDCRVNDPSSLKLSNLTGLRELSVTDSHIRDIPQFSIPAGLLSLSLQNNEISDISGLSKLTNLISLNLAGNQIKEITPLATLKMLGVLNLSGNHISNIGPLSSLSNLSSLFLEDNDIVDLAPLLEIDFPQPGVLGITADCAECGSMELHIQGNPLSDASIENYIAQLKEVGVVVDY